MYKMPSDVSNILHHRVDGFPAENHPFFLLIRAALPKPSWAPLSLVKLLQIDQSACTCQVKSWSDLRSLPNPVNAG